ncbi:CUE domain-containing protein 1 [Adelges cooleyi]|uniref:CUE domain-containing protein 1 n=1 Tax=Adelges cooleyi TaxID=133065 RepID=UPI00217FEDCD|nr:CUE domain-containing protein 1 [Adelges cooleyi]XP_050435627.1 CUE domain-containing protein 1 [Adelges cooleyi]
MATLEREESSLESMPVVGLDFQETMNNFRIMFPTLDDDVIEAVLRSNKGCVDPTIDQLLTMSNDCRTDFKPSGSVSTDAKPQHAFIDPMLPDVLHNLTQINELTKRWNPPLLGPLPNDFLRLTVNGHPQLSDNELNDEQIAILLQNEEFLIQLKRNEHFLTTLEKDSPMEEQTFFVANNVQSDDDAAFKERLKNMGKASRKKFIQIARVFTGKKKKSSARNILGQGDNHTKDNLFLQEEEH